MTEKFTFPKVALSKFAKLRFLIIIFQPCRQRFPKFWFPNKIGINKELNTKQNFYTSTSGIWFLRYVLKAGRMTRNIVDLCTYGK